MMMFPDEELESYIRDVAGLPEIEQPEATQAVTKRGGPVDTDLLKRMLLGGVAKYVRAGRNGSAR